MEDNKKKGFGMVLEGGGMRGLYTAGVLDELMEQGIYADSTVGVSAGAIFGCNYKSRQIGRTLRYNTRFCKDKRYMGLKSWITTGDLYSKDFAYGEVPWKLDVFDTETFARSPMKFTVVCTDIETGKYPRHTSLQDTEISRYFPVLLPIPQLPAHNQSCPKSFPCDGYV